MGKRAYVLLLALLLLLTGCSAAAPAAEKTEEALPTTSAASSAAPSAEAEEPSTQPSAAADPNAPVDIVTADEGKEFGKAEHVPDYKEPTFDIEAFYDPIVTEKGQDLSADITLYPEERLNMLVAGVDYGEWLGNSGIRNFMGDFLRALPTDAVRYGSNPDKQYYVVYDTDTNMRIFVWFFLQYEWGAYEQVGYPIFMTQTLSYSDFSGVQLGDDAEKVKAIDEKVTQRHLERYYAEEEQYTLNAINNGFPPISIHLLSDGIIKFTYGRQGDTLYVTDITYSDDFTLTSILGFDMTETEEGAIYNTIYGDICYQIDPLDYVVNSSLTE